MSFAWTLHRFRSGWFSANLPLLVLRLLSRDKMSEWEILASLHKAFGLSPTPRELGRLEASLVRDGYVSLTWERGDKRLEITSEGVELLQRLESENASVVAGLGP
ncbi:MAG TPA: hypothetical protein VLX56_07310 [Nitrososphaerales archaeon]|nr:hypothetical protein [Nitrososphaerales archaeon]